MTVVVEDGRGGSARHSWSVLVNPGPREWLTAGERNMIIGIAVIIILSVSISVYLFRRGRGKKPDEEITANDESG